MDQRFEGVPDTLFIPLWARIEASERFPELLFDQRALALEPARLPSSICSLLPSVPM